MDLNKVMLLGRLTRDPEVRTTTGGTMVANLAIATNSFYKDSAGQKTEKVEYHDIVVWSKLAEIAQQFLSKGRRVFVEGRLQTRDWTGTDGVRKFKTEVVAENLIMLDGPKGNEAGYSAAGNSGAPRAAGQPPRPTSAAAAAPVDEEEIRVEDIPF
ncbi:MAG: single-stranded DNA-binding protein [Patescibacteria group bacterium]